MRLVLIVLIFSYFSIAYQITKYTIISKLIEKIAKIVTKKTYPIVCQDGVSMADIYLYFRYASFTLDCNKADIVVSNSSIPAFHKPFLAMSYEALIKNDDAVAGLYWLDGRYQLVFVKERLKKFGIVLPKEYKQFEVSIKDLSF
ncbi:hypothetical protein [Hydrogenobaculum acidophilum]